MGPPFPKKPDPDTYAGDTPFAPTPVAGARPAAEATPLSLTPGEPIGVLGFPPGSIVAGRYRIVRFIAAGGMGEVYEAEDQILGAPVAVKTIRPELVARAEMMERFRREILLARRVTHRNVCRLFDLGQHVPA